MPPSICAIALPTIHVFIMLLHILSAPCLRHHASERLSLFFTMIAESECESYRHAVLHVMSHCWPDRAARKNVRFCCSLCCNQSLMQTCSYRLQQFASAHVRTMVQQLHPMSGRNYSCEYIQRKFQCIDEWQTWQGKKDVMTYPHSNCMVLRNVGHGNEGPHKGIGCCHQLQTTCTFNTRFISPLTY